MTMLKHCRVFRGGVTSQYLTHETESCNFDIKPDSIEFRFELASKGGGTTQVLLEIGKSDLAVLLEQVAQKWPEQSTLFSQCAIWASKLLLEKISKVDAASQLAINTLQEIELHFLEGWLAAPVDAEGQKLRELLRKTESVSRVLSDPDSTFDKSNGS